MSEPALERHDITGVILAGGQGTRMGGVDKGLQPFAGQPLVWHALQRLRPQVGALLINANRYPDEYQQLGVPVHPDAESDFPGPLAGFLVGMQEARTSHILVVPCDSPRLPLDLAARLAQALHSQQADIAMVSAPETAENGTRVLRPQPVFCLIPVRLMASLREFMASGQRKIDRWTAQHRTVLVPFDRPQDDPTAFANINTLAELHALPAAS
jgi:molybdopterin-guanine dinucleotide biosynthesis protein A